MACLCELGASTAGAAWLQPQQPAHTPNGLWLAKAPNHTIPVTRGLLTLTPGSQQVASLGIHGGAPFTRQQQQIQQACIALGACVPGTVRFCRNDILHVMRKQPQRCHVLPRLQGGVRSGGWKAANILYLLC